MSNKLLIERSIDVSEDSIAARVHYEIVDDVTREFFGTANVHLVLANDGQLTVDQLKEKVIERSKEILAELATLLEK
jgi:hypothetical protein